MNVYFLALSTAIGLVFGWYAIGFVIARTFLNTDHHHHDSVETPADRGIAAKRLLIPSHSKDSGESHMVAAWMLIPESKNSRGGACVVMVHGFSSGKDRVKLCDKDPTYRGCTLDQGANALWQAGFHVVAIDLRNHGESSDNGSVTLGACEAYDVLATVEYLTQNANEFGINPKRIGLRGESMGGAACLIAAAIDQDKRVSAVWTDSAFARAPEAVSDFLQFKGVPRLLSTAVRFWLSRLTGVSLNDASPTNYIGQIDCPVFLAHSTGDTVLPVYHLDNLSASEDWAQEPEIWKLEAYEHNRLWRDPNYHQRQIDFFKRRLAS